MTQLKIERTSLMSEENQVQETNDLERIYNHFIKEQNGNPIPFGKWEISCTVLELIGASGGIYIWPVVEEFAKGKTPWIAWSFKLTNPLSNMLFLINAAEDLSDNIITELNPPSALRDIIKPLAGKALVIKYIQMGIGSVIFCSVPFGAATYLFPLPSCEAAACLGVTITHSIASNAILHAIAWDIILRPEYWIYRLPFIPFEKAYEYTRNHFRTQEEQKQLVINSKKDAIYQTYRTILKQTFSQAADRIVGDYIKTHSTETLSELANGSVTTFVNGNPVTITPAPRQSAWKSYLYSAHNFFRNHVVNSVGAAATIIGGVAWVANPIYLGLQEGLTLAESIAAGGIPTYSTLVLFAFYGANVSSQLYNYLTSWNGIRSKFSLEAQLYPKTFALFLPINLYIAYFAYAAAQELITTIFSDDMWDDYRPFFLRNGTTRISNIIVHTLIKSFQYFY